MENEPPDFLQIPITDNERTQADRRSRSSERLLPDAESVYSQPFEERDDVHELVSPITSRFPSVRGHPAQPRRLHSYQGGQYAAISPIDEEDIVDASSGAPSRPTTIPPSEKSFEPLVPLPDLWTPVWLRRSTLAAFMVFFVLSTLALIILWVLSATRNGFEIHFVGPHHAWWVYIPTIAVVLLVGLWRQVDYHTKALTSWDELQRGPITPAKSLLLNYVSPLQIVALFEAFVHNHIPIVATVSSFIFLKLITVFSTGLFILLPKDVSSDSFPLVSTSRFVAANGGNLNDISSAPVVAFYSNVYQGVPLQPGVWVDKAYTPFRYDESQDEKLAENATFSADVDGFVPTINCRSVEARMDGNNTRTQAPSGNMFGDGIRISIPGDALCDNYPAVTLPALNPQIQIAPANQVYGNIQTLTCGTQNETAGIIFTVLDLSFEQELRDGAVQFALAGMDVATASSRTVNEVTAVICDASYTISTVKVSNDTLDNHAALQGIEVSLAEDSQNRTLNSFTASDLMESFGAIAQASQGMFRTTLGADGTSGFFTLLAMHGGSTDLGQLRDANVLSAAIEPTFNGIMAHYASQSLSQPQNEDLQGRAVRRESRYVVNDPSAALMIGAMVVAIIAAAILLFSAPRAVVPRDPGSIAAITATLTNSIELNRLLRRSGVPGEKSQEAALDGYEFGTAISTNEQGQASFKIVTSEGVKDPNAPIADNKLRWWHPITASLPFAIVVFAIPFLLIGLLEYTQRRSEDGGIVSVPDNQATDIYTHYIPSLIMVIVASLVNLIDFNVTVFAPYASVSKAGATHKESLLAHYLGVTPVWAVFQAFQARHLNVILSTLSAIVASILAIVAAGLYNVDQFTTTGSDLSLRQTDQFSLQWDDSATTDNGAAATVNTILHDGMNWPAFTNRTLVLPTFSVQDGDLSTQNGTRRNISPNATQIELDVLEADLQCYLVERNFISVSSNETSVEVDILASLPESCQLASSSGQGNFVSFSHVFDASEQGVFAGRQNDLLFGNGSEFMGNMLTGANETLSSMISDNPAVGCPSLAFTYGRVGSNSTAEDITAMLCYQRIRSVTASFSTLSNTTAIDSSKPITVDQSDNTLLDNPQSTSGDPSVFNFRIQDHLQQQIQPFPDTNDAASFDLDGFFQGMLHTDSRLIDPASLAGVDNQNVLLRAIMIFYRVYMAQAISMNMRIPFDGESTFANSTLIGSLSPRQATAGAPILGRVPTTIRSPRLVQARTTKILLQALLGLTSVLMISGWALTRFRRVLPVNPLSIAGAMSLLAGSDLAHSADDGLCECCGKPRRNSFGHGAGGHERESIHASREETGEPAREGVIPVGAEWLGGGRKGAWGLVFAGKRYSMGWWREDHSRGRRRRWGIDVGERPDGDVEDDWELGKRRLRASQGASPGMRFEMSPDLGRGRELQVPGREGGYGDGGLRAESADGSVGRAEIGSGWGSRGGSVDMGDERGRTGFETNFSRGGYRRVDGDLGGGYRGEA
jgi:hypothetical protein